MWTSAVCLATCALELHKFRASEFTRHGGGIGDPSFPSLTQRLWLRALRIVDSGLLSGHEVIGFRLVGNRATFTFCKPVAFRGDAARQH